METTIMGSIGFGGQDLGFRAWGLGFKVRGKTLLFLINVIARWSGFRIWGLGLGFGVNHMRTVGRFRA